MLLSALWPLAMLAVAAATSDHRDEYEPDDYEEISQSDEDYTIEEESLDRRRRDLYEYDFEDDDNGQIYVRRRKRETCDEQNVPLRITKRYEYGNERTRRSPRIHQYEVHEFIDESELPPFSVSEEMFADGAEHYHRAYITPGAPAPSRYLAPQNQPVSSNINVRHSPKPLSAPVRVARRPVRVRSQRPLRASVSRSVNVAPAPLQNFVPGRVVTPVSFVNTDSVHGFVPINVASVDVPIYVHTDQAATGAHHKQQKHVKGHKAGGGHENFSQNNAAKNSKSSKGYKTEHHIDKGAKGSVKRDHHKKKYGEAAGEKKKHHDNANHQGSHEEEAHGHRGSEFDEKKESKKGHKTKGYHNKYHKDEYHKEHKFYDDFHKSGEHHRYGKFHAKHASDDSGHKKTHHVNAGHDVIEKGKKGYSNKGHVDADHKGHKSGQGHEEHYENKSEQGKKSGKEGGKVYGYKKKN